MLLSLVRFGWLVHYYSSSCCFYYCYSCYYYYYYILIQQTLCLKFWIRILGSNDAGKASPEVISFCCLRAVTARHELWLLFFPSINFIPLLSNTFPVVILQMSSIQKGMYLHLHLLFQ